MELKNFLGLLRKWSWLVALTTLVAGVFSYWGTSRMPRVYETTTTLMVGQFTNIINPSAQDLRTSQDLARSYVQLVPRRSILKSTVDALGLGVGWETVAEHVTATPIERTQLMEISVEDTNPLQAKLIADEIARQLILQSPTPSEQEQKEHRQFINHQLRDLQTSIEGATDEIDELKQRLGSQTTALGIQDSQDQMAVLQQKIALWRGDYATLLNFYEGSRTNYLSVMEPAALPTRPVRPKTWLNVSVAASLGFLLALGAALFLEYLDDTIKSSEDVEQLLKLPTLGSLRRIPDIQEPHGHLVTLEEPFSPITEGYRALRINIQFSTLTKSPTPTLLVTSALPGEGKTTTAANLAVVTAQAGKRVLLVDADLRRPLLHELFGVSNATGLTSLLLDNRLAVDTVLINGPVSGLRLLPSGPLPPNRAELLGSKPMEERIDQMKELADVIIFDSPPVLAVADATIIGTLCSGVVLVADSQHTRSEVVRQSKEALEQVGLQVLGIVLNNLRASGTSDYWYKHAYSHADQAAQATQPRRGARAWASLFGLKDRLS